MKSLRLLFLFLLVIPVGCSRFSAGHLSAEEKRVVQELTLGSIRSEMVESSSTQYQLVATGEVLIKGEKYSTPWILYCTKGPEPWVKNRNWVMVIPLRFSWKVRRELGGFGEIHSLDIGKRLVLPNPKFPIFTPLVADNRAGLSPVTVLVFWNKPYFITSPILIDRLSQLPVVERVKINP